MTKIRYMHTITGNSDSVVNVDVTQSEDGEWVFNRVPGGPVEAEAILDVLQRNRSLINDILGAPPAEVGNPMPHVDNGVSAQPHTPTQECGSCWTFRTQGLGRPCGKCKTTDKF